MSNTTKSASKTIETGLVISSTTRLNNSINGNPKFRIYFTNGRTAITQSDSAVSYDVENEATTRTDNRGTTYPRPLDVTFSKAGYIENWAPTPTPAKSDILTWADGFGIWHAAVPYTTPGAYTHKGAALAKAAIVEEIAQREQKTGETLEQARTRISEVVYVESNRDPNRATHIEYVEIVNARDEEV